MGDNEIEPLHSLDPKKTILRWLIVRDLEEVLQIVRDSFSNAWTREEFVQQQQQPNCIVLAAENAAEIVGYVFYELYNSHLKILDLVVARRCRRQGIGSAILELLKNRLSYQKRRELVVEVRETNLSAQLFLRSCGFTATGVKRAHFDDTGEDAYLMVYSLPRRDS